MAARNMPQKIPIYWKSYEKGINYFWRLTFCWLIIYSVLNNIKSKIWLSYSLVVSMQQLVWMSLLHGPSIILVVSIQQLVLMLLEQEVSTTFMFVVSTQQLVFIPDVSTTSWAIFFGENFLFLFQSFNLNISAIS